jgi:hypothetical protein
MQNAETVLSVIRESRNSCWRAVCEETRTHGSGGDSREPDGRSRRHRARGSTSPPSNPPQQTNRLLEIVDSFRLLTPPTHLLEYRHWASLRVPEDCDRPTIILPAGIGAGVRRLSGGRFFAPSRD